MVKKTTLYNSDNEKLYPRTSAECVGYGDGTVKDALDNTGVGDYPAFSASTAYSAGDVVNYNGKLYKFTADHAAGTWTGTDVEETDTIKAHIVQEFGDDENAVISQKTTTEKFTDLESKLDNQPFKEIYLYKESYRLSRLEKYRKIRSVVLDYYVEKSESDNKRYQVTQLITRETGEKIVNIYSETDEGKFDVSVASFKNGDGDNFYSKTLFNGTIIYIYIDWNLLTETITVNEVGAYSDDSVYVRHAGYINDNLNKSNIKKIEDDIKNLNNDVQLIVGEDFFNFKESIALTERTKSNNFFKDILIEKALNVSYITLVYIMYKRTISEKEYISINLREYNDDGTRIGDLIIESKNNGVGIEYLECTSAKGTKYKFLVNWDAFLGEEDIQLFYDDSSLIETYYTEHYGPIKQILFDNHISDYTIYDQMFILDGKVVCNNNYPNDRNSVVAKYAQVDMKGNVSLAKLRFIATKTFTTTLVVTNLKDKGNVDNIIMGSIHVCFHRNHVEFGIYKDKKWDKQRVEYENLSIGEEYIVGIELPGSNQLKLILPDSTEQTFTIDTLDNYVGNRFIIEHYFINSISTITHNVDGYSPFTGVYCKGSDNTDVLKDNFKRGNGSLGVAPTGQIYTLFHNFEYDSRTDFDN